MHFHFNDFKRCSIMFLFKQFFLAIPQWVFKYERVLHCKCNADCLLVFVIAGHIAFSKKFEAKASKVSE